MTWQSRLGWGIALMTAGSILLAGGVALSISLIGACVGIPLALMGLPLCIWGCVWGYQAQMQKSREVLASGIEEGIRAANRPLEAIVAVTGAAAEAEIQVLPLEKPDHPAPAPDTEEE